MVLREQVEHLVQVDLLEKKEMKDQVVQVVHQVLQVHLEMMDQVEHQEQVVFHLLLMCIVVLFKVQE